MNILVKNPRSGLLPTVLYELSYLQSRARVNQKLTKEGPSGEGKETVIKINVVMDAEAMSGLRNHSVYLGFSEHGHNANEM